MGASQRDADLEDLVRQRVRGTDEYRPRILRPHLPADLRELLTLMHDLHIDVHDTLLMQLGELVKLRHPKEKFSEAALVAAVSKELDGVAPAHYGVWVYYPWASRLVHLLDEPDFVAVRTSRNQYKITPAEQQMLATKRVGIIGLSVGQTIALALAMERSCGEIRLADFDILELSNLNRVRTSLASLALPKAVAVAREIAELDPFLPVDCFFDGITDATIDPFLTDGGALDLLIEVCDGLDAKLLARQRARAAGISVLMQTSDRGMVDVERFDREPRRPLLHGLIDDLDYTALTGLSNEEKVPHILAMLGIDTTSERLKASMLEVEQTISTWPQLAGAVMLGSAVVSDVARRILLDQFHDSGRFFVDLQELIADRHAPTSSVQLLQQRIPLSREAMTVAAEACALPPVPFGKELDSDAVPRLVEAATCAPSGGNTQPWQWLYYSGRLYLFCDPSRGSFLDIASTASYVALGAAAENLILQAHADGLHVQFHRPPTDNQHLVAVFTFGADARDVPSAEAHPCDGLAEAITVRATNRTLGPRRPLADAQLQRLQQIVQTVPGARLDLVTSSGQLDEVSAIVGATERIRLCNRASHRDFVNEIRWTDGEARVTGDGIDLATIDLSATERAGLSVARSWPVVAAVKQWGGGTAFEQLARKSIDTASCVGLLTMPRWTRRAFFDGGRAMQRLWLSATLQGIAVQPVGTAIFLFARMLHAEGAGLDERGLAELQDLRKGFVDVFPVVSEQRGEILLFRLTAAAEPRTRALRRPVHDVLSFAPINDDERGHHRDR